ncbi:MAG: lipid-A-disaccharide synthase N-terminal domain-containing protein [Acidobacteriota bacterium]
MKTELWIAIGFLGQIFFSARFLVQWWTSERRKRSVVPVSFWYFSLAGGLTLLMYALHRQDPVFIAGQAVGSLIYLRNLALIRTRSSS